jgi:hypothetical protein
MVRESYNLKQAASQIGHPLDPDEAEKVERRRDFQEILGVEKNKYYAAVANDPSRTKSTVLGRLTILAEKLTQQGDYDKAAVVLEKLAKIEGWTGGDSTVNVFSGLSSRDISEARERIAAEITGNGTKPSKELAN